MIKKVLEKLLLESLWVVKKFVGGLFVGYDETVGRFVEEKQVTM